MEKRYSIGVDVGGSHITCAVIDLESRQILRESVVSGEVDNKAGADEIISMWSRPIAEVLSFINIENIAGLGFAMPGPFDSVNGICLIKGVPKYEKLYGTDIGKALSARLKLPSNLPFRFINDASAFAMGEAWAGKGSGFDRLMAITLGTGFGSAFIDSLVPVVTGDSVPDLGCVYHVKYRRGIADDYFSTRWFTSMYLEMRGKEAKGVYEIATEAASDPALMALFKQFGGDLGRFLSPFLTKFHAGALVIGGNISKSYKLFGRSLEDELASSDCNVSCFASELLEDSALLGSGHLLDNNYWTRVQGTLQFM